MSMRMVLGLISYMIRYYLLIVITITNIIVIIVIVNFPDVEHRNLWVIYIRSCVSLGICVHIAVIIANAYTVVNYIAVGVCVRVYTFLSLHVCMSIGLSIYNILNLLFFAQ
jgi:hypothetical protein